MIKRSTSAFLILGCLLVSASAHRHVLQDEQPTSDPAAAVTPAVEVPQTDSISAKIDPTAVTEDVTTDPAAPAADIDPAAVVDAEKDPYRIDPTPGPTSADPAQMGKRNGFYR